MPMLLRRSKKIKIHEMHKSGEHIDDIAKVVGVSPRTVYRALQEPCPVVPPAPAQTVPVPTVVESQIQQAPRPAPVVTFLEDIATRPPPEQPPTIDTSGDPITVMRALLEHATHTMATLPPDSPRLGPARAEARALVKGIGALEEKLANKETPAETVRRLRREDEETRKLIEEQVLRSEREAERLGVCVHCGQERK